MENSYGSETIDHRVPMQVQYWSGSNFTTNNSDNFSSFNAIDASITDNNLIPSSIDPVTYGIGLFNNGKTNNLMVTAPGMNIRGSVTVELDVPTWLQYDWDNDGLYDNAPSAQVDFCLYRGNDRIIYRQEIFE